MTLGESLWCAFAPRSKNLLRPIDAHYYYIALSVIGRTCTTLKLFDAQLINLNCHGLLLVIKVLCSSYQYWCGILLLFTFEFIMRSLIILTSWSWSYYRLFFEAHLLSDFIVLSGSSATLLTLSIFCDFINGNERFNSTRLWAWTWGIFF